MKLIIPMSGFGERFRRAGYTVPKPLIHIDGRPIIEYILQMFDNPSDVVFICNEEHLANPAFEMENQLRSLCPRGIIASVKPHRLGPVHALRMAREFISDDGPVVVNYCDFTCYWDWKHFQNYVTSSQLSGSIPAYKGFHPHSLGPTNYAYLQVANDRVIDIQEKRPFTASKMDEFASSGTYYFSSSNVMFDAFDWLIKNDISVGGEYYVSLAYKYLLALGLPVSVYPLEHFMQWGTPEDVAEYTQWSSVFRQLSSKPPPEAIKARGHTVMPMAGLGKRFADVGYETPKPLIPVSGRPMVLQALSNLPLASSNVFVLRSDMSGLDAIKHAIDNTFPTARLVLLDKPTDGQAVTALHGLDSLELNDDDGPITVGACDSATLYDNQALQASLHDAHYDLYVWCTTGHVPGVRRPEMYGWVIEDGGRVTGVSVKQPPSNPSSDNMIVGIFTFRNASIMRLCINNLIGRQDRVNGEFYLDSCITDAVALNLTVRIFNVDQYISWGTPDELRTFLYWQSCFTKWSLHPYCIENDIMSTTQAPTADSSFHIL